MPFNRLKQPYRDIYRELALKFPAHRILIDPLHTLAFGTDASFYRLIPEIVLKVEKLEELRRVLALGAKYGVSVTFRAAGTSLSGQAVSDSILIVLTGSAWKGCRVHAGGEAVTLGPSVIGGDVNRVLKRYGRKIGPDPASIESAMIGGIAANNASGMCCGVQHNSYHTLRGMKVLLADGAILDTRDPESRAAFSKSHTVLLQSLESLGREVRECAELRELILRKYKIKNTMGYSLNAFLDYTDPIEMLEHLMIGSEGTLGFIAELTYRTVPEPQFRASALVAFDHLSEACHAIEALTSLREVRAAELMDSASLRAVRKACDVLQLSTEGDDVCAVLVEVAGDTAEIVRQSTLRVEHAFRSHCRNGKVQFVYESREIDAIWKVRKGLFPSVGALRALGTSVIIEDIGFPTQQLAQGALDLRSLLNQHGYSEAIIFGHALAGNLHFVFTVNWAVAGETERYGRFMEALATLVCADYQGSLKSEHGTGRNMAPFVEREWGREAYAVMKRIKALLDPKEILNPGVILNRDPRIHLKNFKALPAVDPMIDACIECGFCEPICPSRDLTLTPRQRISVYREIRSLEASPQSAGRLKMLKKSFKYAGEETCAADGLCSVRCPVGIDTGRLMKNIRFKSQSPLARKLSLWVARHYAGFLSVSRGGLALTQQMRRFIPAKVIERLSRFVSDLTGGVVPPWKSYLPGPAPKVLVSEVRSSQRRAVYFPSCLARTLGQSSGAAEPRHLSHSITSLMAKADIEAVLPKAIDGLCCGLAFESKGYFEAGQLKLAELQKKLWEASREGRDPILFDTSPCFARFKEERSSLKWIGGLYEPAGFFNEQLAPYLDIQPLQDPLFVHTPCSAQKAGLSDAYVKATLQLATDPRHLGEGCCGFAGDKGLHFPELSASAVAGYAGIEERCSRGVSGSPTCEMGLAAHCGISFDSILKLADECSRAKRTPPIG